MKRALIRFDEETYGRLRQTAFDTKQSIDKALHEAGIRALDALPKRRLSLVDHISFLVMKRRNLTTVFAFDTDFKAAGFHLFEP